MKTPSTRLSKIVLFGLDSGIEIKAQYNPKEVSIKKQANWKEHKSSTSNSPHMEFTDGGVRTISFELFFDTFEMAEPVDVSQAWIKGLMQLASVIDPEGQHEWQKRPSRVLVIWGDGQTERFEGVIESLDVKYTMFLPNSVPVRATCNISMKESVAKQEARKGNRVWGPRNWW